MSTDRFTCHWTNPRTRKKELTQLKDRLRAEQESIFIADLDERISTARATMSVVPRPIMSRPWEPFDNYRLCIDRYFRLAFPNLIMAAEQTSYFEVILYFKNDEDMIEFKLRYL